MLLRRVSDIILRFYLGNRITKQRTPSLSADLFTCSIGYEFESDIKKGLVSFYGGKYLDELFRLQRLVGEDFRLNGHFTCDITLELSDLRKMLKYHYDTSVAPRTRKQKAIQRRSMAGGATVGALTFLPYNQAKSDDPTLLNQLGNGANEMVDRKTFNKLEEKFEKMEEKFKKLAQDFKDLKDQYEQLKKTDNQASEEDPAGQADKTAPKRAAAKKTTAAGAKKAPAKKTKSAVASAVDEKESKAKELEGADAPKRRTRAAAKDDGNPGPVKKTRGAPPPS